MGDVEPLEAGRGGGGSPDLRDNIDTAFYKWKDSS